MAKGSTKVRNKMASVTTDVISSRPYRETAEDKARRMRYEAEDALRTLTRAQEIQKNKSLMSCVKQVAREQIKTASAVAGLGKSKSRGK